MVVWLGFLTAFCLWVAVTDFCYRRIPNHGLLLVLLIHSLWLMMPAVGLMPAHSLLPAWPQAMAGFVVGLAMFYPLWRWKAMGAADVKLIATLGYLLALHALLPVVLMASLAAGVHAVVIVCQGQWSWARTQWRQGPAARRGIPYGAYLALSTLIWVMLKAYE